MAFALSALAVLAALLLLLLAVPVDLAFRCRGIEDLDAQLRLGWLFGLVRLELRWPRPGRRRPRRRRKPAPAPAKQPRSRRSRGLALLRQDAFRRRLWRLLRDLLRALRVHDLALHLRLGLGDPADTGRLWAVIGPLGAWLQARRNVQLDIEPEFVDAVLEFDARGRLRLIPLQTLALALAFALSPPSIQAWRSLRAAHV
jgi:hypothetical protein